MTNNTTLKNKIKKAIEYIEKNGDDSAVGVDNSLDKINKDLKEVDNKKYKIHRDELDHLFENLASYKGKPIKKYKTNKNIFTRHIDRLKSESKDSPFNATNKRKIKKETSMNIEESISSVSEIGIDKVNKELQNLKKTLEISCSRIEKNISSNINGNLNKVNQDLLNLKKISKNDISNINSNIDNLFNDIKTEISNNDHLDNKIERFKKDILLEVKNEFKSSSILSDIKADVDVLQPNIGKISGKIDDLSIRFDDLSNGNNLKNISDIPKNEKAIIELSQFMKDGLEQFENISKYYIQKQAEFDQLETKKSRINNQISKAENNAKKRAGIELARKIFNNFPTEFEKITSVFDTVISSKYKKGEEIDANKDRKKLEIYIEGIKEDKFNYEIMTPDISISDEVVIRATVKVITVNKSKTVRKKVD